MFFTLQDKISDKENTTREKVLITLRDQPIKGSDTPKSIGCTVADIIGKKCYDCNPFITHAECSI